MGLAAGPSASGACSLTAGSIAAAGEKPRSRARRIRSLEYLGPARSRFFPGGGRGRDSLIGDFDGIDFRVESGVVVIVGCSEKLLRSGLGCGKCHQRLAGYFSFKWISCGHDEIRIFNP